MPIKTKAKHILIVEDNKDMQEIYKIFFSDRIEKYKIEIAGDVQTALGKIKKRLYDLVILDIVMEPMAGDAFYIYLRTHKETKHIPVIIVSVLRAELLKKLEAMNHVSILNKPITKEQLLDKIDKTLFQ